jgi:putative iron-dependent peroxidase
MDLCFELAAQIMARLSAAVTIVDETHGFKYFDDRDLIGFVDGTENPVGGASLDATIIGDEDPDHRGGSYVIVQKYLHDLPGWEALPIERQEAKQPYAHNVLNVIEDENGEQLEIVRDNMPFGTVGKDEYGTYFIGYARSPQRIERMLDNMFVGLPPGNYDRLLDFSRAVTGSLFFVPTATFLDAVTPDAPAVVPPPAAPNGSLSIGSLKHEA